ncbi:hypothetical protein QUF76_01845 [Desulfobacterales bacterium HSG16]|nr:hypothetical protein [Desulfobacterales bacterium HSG16]
MKRFTTIALAALLVVAFTLPASALENVFGGYWRTRAFTNQNFSGEDQTEAQDITKVDTRTRLYYTAIINDDLKFVNKFEFDAAWGDEGHGDIGADGKNVEVKNSYADFNVGMANAKVGVQGLTISRGFLFADDFAGAVVTLKPAENVAIPLVWIKAYEGGTANNNLDVDYYGAVPVFTPSETLTVQPIFIWATSDNASGWFKTAAYDDVDIYYAGLNLDAKFDGGKFWFTGIYEGGSVDMAGAGDNSTDISAWLAAVGASIDVEAADIHTQAFYATGQDGDSKDAEAFFVPKGQSYYWAEIMGFGTFDDQVSNGSCADQISDIMAANIGATVKAADGLAVTLDLWYATLAEDDANGEKDLGIEVDLKVAYDLVENMKLELIGAYLFAGDATTMKSNDDANPYELGSRISFSF